MTGGKARKKITVGSRLRGSIFSVCLIMLTCIFLWSSQELSRVSAWVPQLILSTTLILLLLQLARELQEPKQREGEATEIAALLRVWLWIVWMLLVVGLTGVSVGAALFCLVYMRFYAGERWPAAAAFSAGLGLGVQLFFGTLMQVSLYPGIIFPGLMN